MNQIRAFLRFITASLFRFRLFLLPVVVAVGVVLSGPGHIQSALKDSGIYEAAPKALLSAIQKDGQKQDQKEPGKGGADLLASPDAQKLLVDSIEPQELQTGVNQITNGVFDWLQGKTDEVEFTIDLTNTHEALLANLAKYAQQNAALLPKCTTPQQMADVAAKMQQQDLLGVTCLPPGITPEQVGTLFSAQVLKDIEPLKDPKLTADDLRNLSKNDGQHQASSQQSNVQLPEAYQLVMQSIWIVVAATVVLAALLVALHTRRRRGVQIIGIALLVFGIMHLVGSLLFLTFLNAIVRALPFAESQGNVPPEVQLAILKTATTLLADFAKTIAYIAGVYSVVGLAVILGEIKTRSKVDMPLPHTHTPTPTPVQNTELPSVETPLVTPEETKEIK